MNKIFIKFLGYLIFFTITVESANAQIEQSSLKIFQEMIEREYQERRFESEREAEARLLAIGSQQRQIELQTNIFKNLYDQRIGQLAKQENSLNKFGLTQTSIVAEIQNVNLSRLSSRSLLEYYIKAATLFEEIINFNFGVITYLNRGSSYAKSLNHDDKFDFFETYKNRTSERSWNTYKVNFIKEHVKNVNNIPRVQRGFYLLGFETELLSESNYKELRSTVDNLQYMRALSELNKREIEMSTKRLELLKQQFDLKESRSSRDNADNQAELNNIEMNLKLIELELLSIENEKTQLKLRYNIY